MPFLLQLHRFNVIVALGAGTIAFGWSRFLHVQNSLFFAIWVSLAVFCIYSGHRIYKGERNQSQPEINVWYMQNRSMVKGVFALSLILSLVILTRLNFTLQQFLILSVGLLLSIWYVVPVFKWRMREISFLKAPLVALVWTTILIGLPLLQTRMSCLNFYSYAGAFFCYFLSLTIPFDIRDLSIDVSSQRTIPTVFGVAKSRWIAVLLIVICFSIIANINQNSRENTYLAGVFLITAGFIVFAKERRMEWYYAAMDASMMLVGNAFFLAS